ncbi:LTA synthase family protein [Pseudoalteromonas phenolica]|uniref:LTA synthase family protein n=1 Tax=Pseudoalteromonas phenolica TaxID=161398 RepID=UPI00384AEB12
MKTTKRFIAPFFPILLFITSSLCVLMFSRLLLSAWQSERLGFDNYFALLLGGIRIDLSTVAYLTLPLFLLLIIFKTIKIPSLQKIVQFIASFYIATALCFLVMLEIATPAFILQYDIRPNRLFIEYLEYPQEVLGMLLSGHKLTLLISLLFTVGAFYLSFKYLPKFCKNAASNTPAISFYSTIFLLFFALVLAARGTVGHRPINPALVYFSQDALVNSLTLNSAYSVAFAIKNMRNEKSTEQLYGKQDKQTVIENIQKASYRTSFVANEFPTLAKNVAYHSGPKKNLVIILEESLGARFVSELGGSGITPEIDKLYNEGWAFEHLYATGTRSVRGIEAVVTGFLPSPSRAVVKLSKSQKHFFTLAEVLTQNGYTTQFLYGGESHFDNMKSFFLGNGFQDIVDFQNIKEPKFVASWGVCDEDLFAQADKELSKLASTNKPFFSLIFSSSNHDPFEIPDNKVSLPDGHETDNIQRDLAIKYADFALGRFINKAKQSNYWQDTVFLIVADHNVRVFGSEPVPIKSFHIPGVILNSDFDNKRDQRLVSQIDLPVTLLSLIGVDTPTPMTGFDLTKTYPVERALMQYYDNFAYIENNQAAILTPGQHHSFWQYDKYNKTQTLVAPDSYSEKLKEKALSHVLFSSMAYQQQLYRLPASTQ